MEYDLRKATLPKNFDISAWMEGGDSGQYALCVMIKLMQEKGFCGSEFHREPVKQLEALLEKLDGFGIKKLAELKGEIKELKKQLEIIENALYEESEWHDQKVRSLSDEQEVKEHNERAKKIRKIINSFNPKYALAIEPDFHENLLKEKDCRQKWDWGTIEFREGFLSENDKPYAKLHWLVLPEALKIRFRKGLDELPCKD